MSALRVAERVPHGGNNIPRKDTLRRFPRNLRHLLHEPRTRTVHDLS